ncbi:MAG: hypothetical protein PVJ16_09550 [Nitrosopumilaceae archaeon]|jgi:hypothetical protein
MLSVLSRKGNDKLNPTTALGICGMVFFGPLGYFSVANIFLKSMISGNHYFDSSLTSISSISAEMNLIYLLALAGGVPGLILGFTIGKFSGRKVIGMEIGAIAGIWAWPFLVFVSSPLEISFYLLGGILVGLAGCYIGRKTGRFAGKVILQKISS